MGWPWRGRSSSKSVRQPIPDALRTCAKYSIDNPGELLEAKLWIDGIEIDVGPKFRGSGLFTDSSAAVDACTGPIRPNGCGVAIASSRQVYSDGYWVMLTPLSIGSHLIRIRSRLSSFPDVVDVTYHLAVLHP